MYANNPELQGETMKGEAGAGERVGEVVTIDDLQKTCPRLCSASLRGGASTCARRSPSRRSGALFADVSGFTQLTKTLQELKGDIRGAEDLNRILSDCFDIMIKSFMMHGGVVAFSATR